MPSDHPEPGLLAAHAEGRLSGAEAAQMDEHLAGCSACHEVFAETLRFVLEEDRILPWRLPNSVAWVRRPAFRLAAVLAVAATVVVVFQQLWFTPAPSDPVAELVQAMGTTRFIEPRLTGGFRHGRFVLLRGAEKAPSLDAYPPAVIAAVASVRARAGNDASPSALRALAVTYLVSGDVGAAVKYLESAVAQAPDDPRLQADLSAAYLVRASRLEEPVELPKALEAAELAVAKENAPLEAWFNRALALEALHLVDAARKAWDDYLKRDSTSEWAEEAKKRRADLPPDQQSTLEEDRNRARVALAKGPSAINTLADESPSLLDDYFQNQLLQAWAHAQLAGSAEATQLRVQAEQAGQALLRATGDALPRDVARALSRAPTATSRDPPRSQALGMTLLNEAQRLAEAQTARCSSLEESRRLLDQGGSPIALWVQERFVVACLLAVSRTRAQAELARLEATARSEKYQKILARVYWLKALTYSDQGEFEPALKEYQKAREIFRETRDAEGEASILVRRAYVLGMAGDARSAWVDQIQGLALLDRVRDPGRRHAALHTVAEAGRQQRLPRSAVYLQSAVVGAARDWGNQPILAEDLIRRSVMRQDTGSLELAAADLEEARSVAARIENSVYLDALADAAEARLLARSNAGRAAELLQRSIDYFKNANPSLVPSLRLLRARSMLAAGRKDSAEQELLTGIRQLESERAAIEDDSLQVAVFDAGAALFDEMIALQLNERHDSGRALYFVERCRGRQLVDALSSPRRTSVAGAADRHVVEPLAPEALRHELPGGVGLVYYATVRDRLVSWLVTRDGVKVWQRGVSAEELQRRVARYEAAIDSASITAVREAGAVLFDELIRPLLPELRSLESIVFVPDHLLQALPFSSLWDAERRQYLVESYLLGVAPSGNVFVRATATTYRAKKVWKPRLLAVGNPRLDRASRLPSLPGAEAEAIAVAALYGPSRLLVGEKATKAAFLSNLRASDVVHFAGHAQAQVGPGEGALLFAQDPEAASPAALFPPDLDRLDLHATRVVVLAGCRSGTGTTFRLEGGLSLARPFLAAGVSSVVASLRDVDDQSTREFALALHRGLLAGAQPARAVREAQLALLRHADPVLSHPSSWAGFVNLGGL